jgi:hypothetical protein
MRGNRVRRAIVLAVTAVVTAGTVAPAGGGVVAEPPVPVPSPTGDISATFTPKSPPGPCITIGGPPTVDFGQLAFGGGFGPGSASTVVTSCGPPGRAQDVMASVSDATAAGVPRWTPFHCGANPPAACITPPNQFAYLLAGVSLTAAPRMIGPAVGSLAHQLRLPAPGSTGGGEVVRMTVTILGVLR